MYVAGLFFAELLSVNTPFGVENFMLSAESVGSIPFIFETALWRS
jgi:hypothetical protein